MLMMDPEPVREPPKELTPEQKAEAVEAYMNSPEGKKAIQDRVEQLSQGIARRRARDNSDHLRDLREAANPRGGMRVQPERQRSNYQTRAYEDPDPMGAIDGYLEDL